MAIHLFTIAAFDQVRHGTALLPGIPASLWQLPDVAAITEGTGIELRIPNGECVIVNISSYCFRVYDNNTLEYCRESCVLLIVPSCVDHQRIPIGTEVWIQ